MTIALKIAITIVAAVLMFPIEYILFPKLDREVEKDSIKMNMIPITFLIVLLGVIPLIVIDVQYLLPNDRKIWYSYLLPMVCSIFWQFVFACTDLQKKFLPVVLPMLALAFIGCIMLPIRDAVLVYESEISSSYIEVEASEQPILSKEQIKARLNATSISEPSYYCGKYIYEINKGTPGYGLALVDAQKMEFLPCEYENQISGKIREHYPKEEIVELGIQLQTENEKTIPYAKFGILKRFHIFSKPKIEYYVLLNMQSGEILEQSN